MRFRDIGYDYSKDEGKSEALHILVHLEIQIYLKRELFMQNALALITMML